MKSAPTLCRGGASPETPAPFHRIWNVPDRSVVLAGHRHLLRAVDRTLQAGGLALVCPAEGRCGTGATTAMVELAHRRAHHYDIAWWIPAADPELVPLHLAALAEALGLAGRTGDAEAATARLLDSLRQRDRYLLVFDDAENPRELARFLPTGCGDTVVISSCPDWRGYATAHPVEPFTRSESVALLRARRPDLPVDAATRVAAALEDLPLAVDPAAALLAGSGMGVEQLLRGVRDRMGDGQSDPAAATWDVTFDHLAGEDPAGLALLTLVAWLGPGPVPLHLVTQHPNMLPRILADVVQDPALLARLAAGLRRRGPARITPDGVALHRIPAALLVARTAEEHLGEVADGWAAVAIRLLRDAVPDNPDDPTTWATWLRLIPLVLAATDPARHLDASAADAGRLLHGAARYLGARGQRRASATLSRDADDICGVTSGRPLFEEMPVLARPPGYVLHHCSWRRDV
jgi:hypothetical protein